jgi:hypothetical protein
MVRAVWPVPMASAAIWRVRSRTHRGEGSTDRRQMARNFSIRPCPSGVRLALFPIRVSKMRWAPSLLVQSLTWTASSPTTSHSLRATCGTSSLARRSGESQANASCSAAKYSRNVRWVNAYSFSPYAVVPASLNTHRRPRQNPTNSRAASLASSSDSKPRPCRNSAVAVISSRSVTVGCGSFRVKSSSGLDRRSGMLALSARNASASSVRASSSRANHLRT